MLQPFYITRLVTDNVDMAVQARHQSTTHQNKSLHWSHSFAVKNRIHARGDLDDRKPQKQVEDLQVAQILPSQDEQRVIQSSLIPLVARVICKYIPVYQNFSGAVVRHIPYPYSSQMSKKSEQAKCLLGLEFLNPNKSGDMENILKKFQEDHVPIKDAHVLHKTIVHGDQLAEERARNVQWTFRLGETGVDRLEGLENTFSEFHFKMCMYEVSNKIFLKEESAGEKGTSFAEMNRTSSSNAKKGPSKDYNAFKDFYNCETSAHIVGAWMEFSGMDSILIATLLALRPSLTQMNSAKEFLNTTTVDDFHEFIRRIDSLDHPEFIFEPQAKQILADHIDQFVSDVNDAIREGKSKTPELIPRVAAALRVFNHTMEEILAGLPETAPPDTIAKTTLENAAAVVHHLE